MSLDMYMIKPEGICCKAITLEIENKSIINNVNFYGGCMGNQTAISKLLKGKTIGEVIEKFKGITCGNKPTSCADQLAVGLIKYLEEYNANS